MKTISTPANLFAAVLLLGPALSWAGGTVTNCTEAELRAAMAGGGTVTFACDGTITVASTITNTVDTVLDGTGHQVVISGGNAVRVFYNTTNVAFTLINLTIANSSATNGSGIFNASGNLNLYGVTFSANVAFVDPNLGWYPPPAEGGAIVNRGGAVNATNCMFLGNSARQATNIWDWPCSDSRGGAILNAGGQLALSKCSFSGNVASGASGPSYVPDPGRPVSPSSGGFGGAILNDGYLVADSCTFASNSAAAGSAGAGYRGSLYGNGFPGDYGRDGAGGAIYSSGTVELSACSFVGNLASGGPGGPGGSGYPGTSPTGGAPGGAGGSAIGAAIYGQARLLNCTAASNVCKGGNGGAGGTGGPSVFPHGAWGRGGNGGAGGSGTVTLFASTVVNCTIAGNQGVAGSGGAGGYGGTSGTNGPNGTAFGGLYAYSLVNSIVASNAPGNCIVTTDAGHNLSSDASPSLTNHTTLLNTDPKLGLLADNGGSTLTMALLPGSPAIDAADTGVDPPTDQRGFPRPADAAADIGAYEYGSMLPSLTITQSGPTDLDILVRANASQPCRLFTSPDLAVWTPIATNNVGSDGTVSFRVNCNSSEACRFYRVSMP